MHILCIHSVYFHTSHSIYLLSAHVSEHLVVGISTCKYMLKGASFIRWEHAAGACSICTLGSVQQMGRAYAGRYAARVPNGSSESRRQLSRAPEDMQLGCVEVLCGSDEWAGHMRGVCTGDGRWCAIPCDLTRKS